MRDIYKTITSETYKETKQKTAIFVKYQKEKILDFFFIGKNNFNASKVLHEKIHEVA